MSRMWLSHTIKLKYQPVTDLDRPSQNATQGGKDNCIASHERDDDDGPARGVCL